MKKLYLSRLFWALLCFFGCVSGNLFAQTMPEPQTLPYRQEFTNLAADYPDGIQGWNASTPSSSAITTPSSFTTTVLSDKTMSAGGSATSASGNIYNFNERIGFLNAGNFLDQCIALALKTTGNTDIEVQYDVMVIRNPYGTGTNTRINEMALQYRVGVTGNFITLDRTYFQNNTTTRTSESATSQSEHITVMLPAACNNQEIVQIRWITRQVSGGGSRPSFAIDNIDVRESNDQNPPVNVSGYPKTDNILAQGFDFINKINEIGKTYFVLLPNGSAAPTAVQVKAGQNSNGASALQSGVLDITNASQEYVKTFSNLSLGTTYSVFSVSEDQVGNIQTVVNKVDATTLSVIPPALSTTVDELNLGGFEPNYESVIRSYQIEASNLTGNVVVTAQSDFLISKDKVTFSSSLTFTPADFASNAKPTVYVKYTPTAIGSFTGSITHETTGVATKIVEATAYGINPLVQNFDDPNVLLKNVWTQYNEAGPVNKWAYTAATRNVNSGTGAVLMNGFSDSGASKDWLISPKLRLDSFTEIPSLSFYSRQYFEGPALKLMVSTDYDGVSSPSTATWTALEGKFPGNTATYTKSEYINLTAYKTSHTYLAWVYETTSSGSGNAAEWSFDDFAITSETKYVDSNPILDFGDASPNSFSASQSFVFTAAGYDDITIQAPASYQLSLDNISFGSSVVVSATDAFAGKTVYARFAPTVKELTISGVLTITGNSLNRQIGSFTASSWPKADTFDVVTYNVSFFGSTNNNYGPANNALQVENVAKVMNKLNADVYALQEVSSDTEIDNLILKLNINGKTFAKATSTSWSYSWQNPPSDPNYPPQKLVVLYNTQTVTVKNTKVLFKELYDQVLAHTVVLPNYPGPDTPEINDDSFFASGRLPYLVELETNIGGVKKTISLIDFHARANSGTQVIKYDQRKYDVDYLKQALDAEYGDANIILLGDLNDDVKAWVGNANTPSSYQSFVEETSGFNPLTLEISKAGAVSYLNYTPPSFLDHIIISNELSDQYIANSTAVYDPRNDISNYISTTSDHGPVIARFELKQDVLSTPDFGKNKYYVKAYPNPATDLVSFDVKTTQGRDLKIRLYDFNGRAIGTPISVKNESEISTAVVPVTNLASGVYFYTVSENNKVIFKDKIIKK
ncbi:T9SS type A sorting domain-containing protein [Flavobacterium panacagri]|uniref:T9SS type A sorting domain-containing protein n=1 Tax=Flavobacterium panacagri TaxID=3034146 RepID=UPI0025A51F95|nr:T9SS type A sorting domain-containing protein [Flavobacterium panacagri]